MNHFAESFFATLVALSLISNLAWAEDTVNFSREVLPILSDRCFQCHGPDAEAREADLRLDQEESVKEDRGGYQVVQPGDPDASEMYQRLVSVDSDVKMPPADLHRPLTDAQISTIRKWIEQGAPWGKHWAFERVERPTVPTGEHPIDYFVDQRLRERGWDTTARADKRTLIRRLSIDLTGLPPTPDEVRSFLEDIEPGSWQRLVDRTLASPAYGERMAWDWLEAARYSDSNGFQEDWERTAWPWRDWVVKAFNNNMPYDQFTVWQLAGDLLPEPSQEQILATAFNRNHMINGEGGRIAEENRVDYVMDMTETMSTIWLGLTLNCCRCHDHKFDPLLQQEYYSLTAFFNQTPVTGAGNDPQTAPVLEIIAEKEQAKVDEAKATEQALLKKLEAEELRIWPRSNGEPAAASDTVRDQPERILAILGKKIPERGLFDKRDLFQVFSKDEPEWADAYDRYYKAKQHHKTLNRQLVRVMVMEDQQEPRKTFILDRGIYSARGDEVSAGVPAILPPLPSDQPINRLSLARWLVSRDHPLTARVTVNRYWQMLFGLGLVKTTEDFGVQGETPLHPDLLDWLAAEFMESGWNVKNLLRTLVTSDAYTRSSTITSPETYERDPKNRYLARGARFRMPSWMIRDQALVVSGLLHADRGGKPVNGYQPAGVWEEATFDTKKYRQDHGDALYRRSLYTFWRRIIGPTLFFDTAKRQVCEVRTLRTNTPMHALTVLNDVTYVEAARALAERVMLAEDDTTDRMNFLSKLVLIRLPSQAENRIWQRGLERAKAEFTTHPERAEQLLSIGESERNTAIPTAEHAAWTALCLNILNLDETLTKE